MATCKNCHRKINRLDSDICPYCGCENPIDSNYKTMDFTSNLKQYAGNEALYRSKKKKIYVLLCMLVGYFGIHEFYLGKKKKAIIEAAVSIVAIAAIGTVLFFLTPLKGFGFLVAFGGVWVLFLILGLILSTRTSLKDGKEEFLR